MKRKYNLPLGYKTWRVLTQGGFGSFRVIGYNKEKVVICDFDGINEQPVYITFSDILSN